MSTRLFHVLSPVANHLVVAALAIAAWVLIIIPLWKFCRSRIRLSNLRQRRIAVAGSVTRLISQNKSPIRWISATAVLLFIFALGFLAGIHKETLSAHLWHKYTGRDVGGNPEGPLMGITQLETAETLDPDAEKNIELLIGIRKQPGASIDHDKVRIFVRFYDAVGDKDIMLTDAGVTYEWLTPKHDWVDINPEVLAVRYLRARAGSEGSAAQKNERKYLGYIVQVYYDDKLQAVQAEPSRLLRLFPPAASISVPNEPVVENSPNRTASAFAKYAMKLREHEVEQIPPLSEPTTLQPLIKRYPWKTNIVTMVFWVGEYAGDDDPVSHDRSCWDANWTANYGGYDNPDPTARRNYIHLTFIPKLNPFYCALPYNDLGDDGQLKPEAPEVIPWFKQAYADPTQSVCWHRWVAIRKGNRTCYAQWEDCGPFRTDHFQYVFGNERPAPNTRHGAGLSVSPAVRDYLGLASTDVVDWQFVEVHDVPPGPWRNYGENNHFVIARNRSEQVAKEQMRGEHTTDNKLQPDSTPADMATIKKWVDEAQKRGEEWGKRQSKD